MTRVFILLFMVLIVLAACGQTGEPATSSAPPGQQTTSAPDETEIGPVSSPQGQAPTTTAAAVEGPAPATSEPTTTPQPEPAEPTIEPIEVTYFTPAQMEGPYYTVDKPDDRDNDLTVLQGAAGAPAGQVLEFGGKVYDASGMPVAGAVIEIWQTDSNGIYLHPNDPGTDRRDRNFQFYGEAVTSADGSYSFRTVVPGRYEPRPRHIHVKVKLDAQELLTTQFYFEGDPELAGEAMFSQAGGDGAHLVIDLSEGQDEKGNPILVGLRDIILNADLSNP